MSEAIFWTQIYVITDYMFLLVIMALAEEMFVRARKNR